MDMSQIQRIQVLQFIKQYATRSGWKGNGHPTDNNVYHCGHEQYRESLEHGGSYNAMACSHKEESIYAAPTKRFPVRFQTAHWGGVTSISYIAHSVHEKKLRQKHICFSTTLLLALYEIGSNDRVMIRTELLNGGTCFTAPLLLQYEHTDTSAKYKL